MRNFLFTLYFVSATFFSFAQVTLVPNIQLPSSSNASDGSIQLSTVGFNGPYSFLWDDGSTGNNRQNLATGSYYITVFDAAGSQVTNITPTNFFQLYERPVLNVDTILPFNCTNRQLQCQISNFNMLYQYTYQYFLKIIYPDQHSDTIFYNVNQSIVIPNIEYGGLHKFSIIAKYPATGQQVSESNIVEIDIPGSYPEFGKTFNGPVCLGDVFEMWVNGIDLDAGVLWNMGDGTTKTDSYISHFYETWPTGNYHLVSVTFTQKGVGCNSQTENFQVYVTNNGASVLDPIIDFYSPTQKICPGDQVKIFMKEGASFDISWANSSSDIIPNPGFYDNSNNVDQHVYPPASDALDSVKLELFVCTHPPLGIPLTPATKYSNILYLPIDPAAPIESSTYCFNPKDSVSVCPGSSPWFSVCSGQNENYSYQWSLPGQAPVTSLIYNPMLSQNTTVQLQVENHCGSIKNHFIIVQMDAMQITDPFAYEFQVGSDSACTGDEVMLQFNNIGQQYVIYFDNSDSIVLNPTEEVVRITHSYASPGNKNIQFIATDYCGNTAMITKTLNVVNNNTTPHTTVGKDIFWTQGSTWAHPSPISSSIASCQPAQLFTMIPGETYTWCILGDTIITNTPFVNYAFTQSTYLELIVSNSCGNSITVNGFVDVDNTPCQSLNVFTNYLQQPTCANPRGSFVVSASGGTPPYVYEWDLNQSTIEDTITNVLPGIYRVTATDALGAKGILDVEIKNPINTLQLSTTVQSPSNCHITDGSAQVAVAGGVGPYTYRWSTGLQTDALHENLAAGTYAVTVTDAQSCSRFAMLQVRDAVNTPSIINSQLTPPSCHGAKDGSIQVNCPPGGGYQYYWSNGDQDAHNQNLGAGTYYLQITNSLGCVLTEYFTLSQPEPLKIKVDNMVSPNPCGSNTGQVVLSIQGGTAPYSNYSWSDTPGSFTNTRTDLIAQAYTVTVTDANSCQDTISVYVDELPVDIVKTDQKSASCNQSDGIVSLQIFKKPGFDSDFISLTGELLGSGQSPWTYNAGISEKFTAQAAGIKLVKASATQPATNNTCVTYRRHVLPTTPPDTHQICLVTVNDSNQNVVVWEPSTALNIDHYLIYREDFISGNYDEIHLSDIQQTEWTDKGADAGLKSHRYRLASVNTCGVASEPGAWHRAAHSNVYVSADQDSLYLRYESYAGFALDSIYILADTTGVMPYTWFVLDQKPYVPGTQVYGLALAGSGLQSAYAQNKLLLAVDFPKDQACSGVKANNRNSGRSNGDKDRGAEIVIFFAQAQTTGSTGPCDGTAQINVFGGTPPYSYNWGAGYVTGDAFRSSLCMGPYQVTVIDANNNQRIVPFTIGAFVGMPEPIQNTGLMIYPNPSQDKVWIESTQDPLQEVSIYSVSGALVYQTKVLDNSLHVISLHHWPAGLYQVHAQVGDRIRVLKLLKH